MLIDFHTHISPPEIKENRSAHFADEPAFELLYSPEKSKIVTAEDIIAAMDTDGVEKSVVFGFPWTSAERFTRHNDYVMESCAKYPGRLIGLGCFDIYHKDAPKEALRCLEGGLAGLGELAAYRSGLDEEALTRLEPVMEAARCHKALVLIHVNEPVGHYYPGKAPISLDQIWNLAARFPENRLVLAHWGGGVFFYRLMKKKAKEVLANVWYDTAASPYLYDPKIYAVAASILGVEKILFGTDFPLLGVKRCRAEVESSGLSPEEISAVLGGNALGLLDMK